MKVALTVWNDRISPVFDSCQHAQILAIEQGRVLSHTAASFNGACPEDRIATLVANGVTVLICGAISEPLQSAFLDRGVDVIGFVAGDVNEVLTAFLSGELPNLRLAMPGCCARRWRHHNRRRQHCRGRFQNNS